MKLAEYYKNITRTTEEDILLIEPYSAGDIYQTLSLVDHLREKYHPKKINLACLHKGLGVVKLFNNIDNLCTFPHIDGEKLQLLANTQWYSSQSKLFICYPPFFYSHFTDGADYMMRKKIILGIDNKNRPKQSNYDQSIFNQAKESAEKQGLKPGSIIIFNHAYTIKPIPADAYELLAAQYPGKVYYDKWSQGHIKGAIPLEINLEEVPYFADIAGNVILMRSGILELLSASSANIYCIYPDSAYCNDWTPTDHKQDLMDFIKTMGAKDLDLNPNSKEKKIYIKNDDSIKSMQEKIIATVLPL